MRVIGYVRVSKARERMVSPEIQRTAVLDWCARNGSEVVDWIEELDRSGRTFAREGVQRAIERASTRDVDAVVVWKWSRFGRNMRDALNNLDTLERNGGRLVAATEDFDTQTLAGRFGRGVFLLMADFESGRISESWKDTHKHRVSQGLTPDGRPRFGYVRDGDRYVPNPAEAELLRECYRRFIAGDSVSQLCRWLNAHGATNRFGKPWTRTALPQMLDSGFAAGMVVYKGERVDVRGLDGAHEPILHPDEWRAYLAERERRNGQRPGTARAAAFMLTGLASCGECGGPMWHHNVRHEPGKVLACYQTRLPLGSPERTCRGVYVMRSIAEAEVMAWVRANADRAAQRSGTALASPRRKAPKQRADKALQDALEARRRLVTGWTEGRVADADYEALRPGLDQRVRDAEAAAQAAAVKPAQPPQRVFADLLDVLEAMDPGKAGQALRHVIARVEVHKDAPRVRIVPA